MIEYAGLMDVSDIKPKSAIVGSVEKVLYQTHLSPVFNPVFGDLQLFLCQNC